MAARAFVRAAAALAIIAATCTSVAAGAAIILLRAEGKIAATLTPGMRLAEGQVFDLGEGDRLWLVDNFGTRKLQGPGRWRLADSDHEAGRSRFEDLVKLASSAAGNERRESVAATRGPPMRDDDPSEPAVLPSLDVGELLQIADVGTDGHYCLWGDHIQFAGGQIASSATLASAAGNTVIAFEGRLSNTVPADYLVRGGDIAIHYAGQVHHARFTRIDTPRDLEELASSAALAGCTSTISTLIDGYPPIG